MQRRLATACHSQRGMESISLTQAEILTSLDFIPLAALWIYGVALSVTLHLLLVRAYVLYSPASITTASPEPSFS